MHLNKKQKFILLLYFIILISLLSQVPRIKSWPCGCTFRCETWIWEEPPLLFDTSFGHGEQGGVALIQWPIDWRRIAFRISIPTFLVLFAIVLTRDRRKTGARKAAEPNQMA